MKTRFLSCTSLTPTDGPVRAIYRDPPGLLFGGPSRFGREPQTSRVTVTRLGAIAVHYDQVVLQAHHGRLYSSLDNGETWNVEPAEIAIVAGSWNPYEHVALLEELDW